jgi:hypothetical protein
VGQFLVIDGLVFPLWGQSQSNVGLPAPLNPKNFWDAPLGAISAGVEIVPGDHFALHRVEASQMTIEFVLFQALKDVKALELPAGIPSSGKKFEDFMVQQLYQKLRQLGTLHVFPPRYTLHQATYSSVAHQFDIVVRQSELTVIECKFRKKTGIDDLFAFMGKLIDYREPPCGIFVTTAEKVNNNVLYYAIAHHILIVCSSLPPVQYMIQRVKKNTDLARRLASLQTRLRGETSPNYLLVEWQNAHRRFMEEGYCR